MNVNGCSNDLRNREQKRGSLKIASSHCVQEFSGEQVELSVDFIELEGGIRPAAFEP